MVEIIKDKTCFLIETTSKLSIEDYDFILILSPTAKFIIYNQIHRPTIRFFFHAIDLKLRSQNFNEIKAKSSHDDQIRLLMTTILVF